MEQHCYLKIIGFFVPFILSLCLMVGQVVESWPKQVGSMGLWILAVDALLAFVLMIKDMVTYASKYSN